MTLMIQRHSDRVFQGFRCASQVQVWSSLECAGFDDHLKGVGQPFLPCSPAFHSVVSYTPDIPAISCSLHADVLLPSIFFHLPLCSLGKNFYSSLGPQGNRPCCEVFLTPAGILLYFLCAQSTHSVYASCCQSVISCSVSRFYIYFPCSKIHHGLV